MKVIPIFKDSIPYSYSIRIAGQTYEFNFNYNAEGDYFTVDLSSNGEVLCYGEKVVYGRPLFLAFKDIYTFPRAAIVPGDIAGNVSRAGYEEVGADVFLFVITQEEIEDALSAQN